MQLSMNDSLCAYCKDLFEGEPDFYDYELFDRGLGVHNPVVKDRPHHASVEEFRICGQQVCRLCSLIWHETSDLYIGRLLAEEVAASGENGSRLFASVFLVREALRLSVSISHWHTPAFEMRLIFNLHCELVIRRRVCKF